MKKLQTICFLLIVGFSTFSIAFASEIAMEFVSGWVKDIYQRLFSFLGDYFELK